MRLLLLHLNHSFFSVNIWLSFVVCFVVVFLFFSEKSTNGRPITLLTLAWLYCVGVCGRVLECESWSRFFFLFVFHGCMMRAGKACITFLCLQTTGFWLRLVSSDSHAYLQKQLLYFVWVLIGHQSNVFSLEMGDIFLLFANDYRQMKTQWYLWRCCVEAEQRWVYTAAVLSVCTCVCLPDQGHALLWVAQPQGPAGRAW